MGIVSSRALPAEMPAHTHRCTRWRSAKSKQKPWVESKATFASKLRTFLGNWGRPPGLRAGRSALRLSNARVPWSDSVRTSPAQTPHARPRECGGARGMKFWREVGLKSREESGPTCRESAEAGPGLRSRRPSRRRGTRAPLSVPALARPLFVLSAPHMV